MGATEATVDAVRQAVAPVLAGLGLDLYDIELNGVGNARTLRITVDRAGGVDLDAIANVTRAVSPLLDDDVALAGRMPSGSYLLEVSSPGVERALRTPAHYVSAQGATVSIKLLTENGTERVHGMLVGSDDQQCTIEIDGRREQIAYRDITQARLVFEWGPQPRPGGPRRARATASKGATA